jgi:pimeloyl-ACP methyl ester carboxylesterase
MLDRAEAVPSVRGREFFVSAPDGTRIWARSRLGTQKVTAILSDGIACNGFIWKYLWGELAAHVGVAHYNYRAHGRSEAPEHGTMTLEACAEDHDAVRTKLVSEGAGPFVLFGHSMGCQVALEAYRNDPSNVAALVLLCGSSGRITYTFRGTDLLAQWLPDVISRIEAHPNIARALWSRVPPDIATKLAFRLGEIDARAAADDLKPYLEHMADLDLLLYMRLLRSAGEHSAADLLPSVKCPVLVVTGDRDAFTPPHCAEEMAAALPASELWVVKGGTHALPIEQKELVRDRIVRFLEERVLGGPNGG